MSSVMKFESPWRRNHCMAIACAHVTETGLQGAKAVARVAKQARVMTSNGSARMARVPEVIEKTYLAPVGGKIVRDETGAPMVFTFGKYAYGPRVRPGMTVRTFMRKREFKRGRWLVYVRHHVVAYVNGEMLGYWLPGMRLNMAVLVEAAPTQGS